MLKWERDICRPFSDSQWRIALKSSFKMTRSSNLWELTMHMIQHYHLPVRETGELGHLSYFISLQQGINLLER